MKPLIIIPSFNTGTYVESCIKSLENTQGVGSCRVLLVDNGSRVPDLARLYDLAGSSPLQIDVVRLPVNTGYVGGINSGLFWRQRNGLTDPVCFLNCDVHLRQNGWLDRWLQMMDKDPEIGVIGGGNRRFFGKEKPYDYRTRVDLGILHTTLWTRIPKSVFGECQWVTGTIMLVSPDVLKIVPTIDPYYTPGYWDDSDFCFEVFWGARKNIWASHFSYRHVEMAATKENKYRLTADIQTPTDLRRKKMRNLMYFYSKWHDVIFVRRPSLEKEEEHLDFLKALRAAGRIPGGVTKRVRFIQAQNRMGVLGEEADSQEDCRMDAQQEQTK